MENLQPLSEVYIKYYLLRWQKNALRSALTLSCIDYDWTAGQQWKISCNEKISIKISAFDQNNPLDASP